MVNRSGVKGRLAENIVVAYLVNNGWPYAERRRLTGALDRGDIAGTPGICWEVKHGSAHLDWWAWMRETNTERANAKADVGVLVVKPPKVGDVNVGRFYAAVPEHALSPLLAAVGSGSAAIGPAQLYKTATFPTTMALLIPTIDMSFTFVRLYPPGKLPDQSTHICVTHLGDMVRLLRLAGYGDPLSSTTKEFSS